MTWFIIKCIIIAFGIVVFVSVVGFIIASLMVSAENETEAEADMEKMIRGE